MKRIAAQVVEVLSSAARVGADPRDVQTGIRGLRAAFPDHRFDLLVERDAFDESTTYDVVVRARGEGTLVVSLYPDRGLPFIARGSYRRGEADLLRVDAHSMRVQEAMSLFELGNDEAFARQAVDALLVRQALEAADLADAPVSDADLQRAVDRFRRRHGLLTAAETQRWLADRGKTLAMLETALEDEVRVLMLRRKLFDAATEAELDNRLPDYDVIVVSTLVFPSAVAAQRFHDEAHGLADAEFHRAAARWAAHEGLAVQTRRWRRHELPEALARADIELESGLLVGPTGNTIYRPCCCVPARPDDATRVAARDRLFMAWLDDQRREADIEWFWGTPQGRG